MIELNAPKGLGDAIYLRAVALHFLGRGEHLKIWTRWREVFTGLGVEFADADAVDTLIAKREREPRHDLRNVTACLHCRVPYIMARDKFALACLQAGIEDEIELRMCWSVSNASLVSAVRSKADGRPILIYQPPRHANNAPERVLQPHRAAVFKFLESRGDYLRVKIGHPEFTVDGPDLPCDLDLYGKTSVPEAFDLISDADLVFGENCFLPVAAQAMDRSFVLMMSRRALTSNLNKVRGITPERMVQKPHLGRVIFDE